MKIKVLSRNIQFPRKFAFKQFVWFGWWVYYYHAALSSIDWHDHNETCRRKKKVSLPASDQFIRSSSIRFSFGSLNLDRARLHSEQLLVRDGGWLVWQTTNETEDDDLAAAARSYVILSPGILPISCWLAAVHLTDWWMLSITTRGTPNATPLRSVGMNQLVRVKLEKIGKLPTAKI